MAAKQQEHRSAAEVREDDPTYAKAPKPMVLYAIAAEQAAADPPRASHGEVTLFVYGWINAQPGPLSWVFPSLFSATGAVLALRNAVRWAILRGRIETPMDGDDSWKRWVLVEKFE